MCNTKTVSCIMVVCMAVLFGGCTNTNKSAVPEPEIHTEADVQETKSEYIITKEQAEQVVEINYVDYPGVCYVIDDKERIEMIIDELLNVKLEEKDIGLSDDWGKDYCKTNIVLADGKEISFGCASNGITYGEKQYLVDNNIENLMKSLYVDNYMLTKKQAGQVEEIYYYTPEKEKIVIDDSELVQKIAVSIKRMRLWKKVSPSDWKEGGYVIHMVLADGKEITFDYNDNFITFEGSQYFVDKNVISLLEGEPEIKYILTEEQAEQVIEIKFFGYPGVFYVIDDKERIETLTDAILSVKLEEEDILDEDELLEGQWITNIILADGEKISFGCGAGSIAFGGYQYLIENNIESLMVWDFEQKHILTDEDVKQVTEIYYITPEEEKIVIKDEERIQKFASSVKEIELGNKISPSDWKEVGYVIHMVLADGKEVTFDYNDNFITYDENQYYVETMNCKPDELLE